jgi:putative transposase
VSAFIDEHRERFGVEPICRTLGVSASAYYHRASGERSARRVEDERLLEEIRRVHKANYECYGYRRTWKQLLREGERVPRCQVQRLMRDHGIQGAKRRGKPWRTTTADPQAERRPDLVGRDFTASATNRLWVGDFTYLRCWEGVLYFAFVIDVFSRMIVGWQLASHMRTDLVLDALRMALSVREPGADFRLVAHTDAGSQYTSRDYTQTLDDHRVLASIGTVGDALDNALAESFVDSYKTELIADRAWRTRAQLELATVEYVGWFNHVRLHESLGDIPPVEFEQLHGRFGAHDRLAVARHDNLAGGESTGRANGPGPTAAPLPPVEMTSHGQPTNGSAQVDRPRGLPTGLGQPTNGSAKVNGVMGCPHSPRRLQLSSVELKNIKTNQPT